MRVRLAAAVGVAVVAISVVAVAWLQDVPAISGEDAVTATEEALESAGLDVEVEPDPVLTTYTPRSSDAVDVWAVRAIVRSEPIELRLALAGADPVAIDDRSLDGSTYVLSEGEYEAVAGGVDDPSRARTVRRNISFTCAAVLVVALAIAHAAMADTDKERRG